MISKEQATIIAHELINDTILKESCKSFMNPSAGYPLKWIFYIYHKNQDEDVFLTIIEITNNGVVADWSRQHVGNDIDGN